jgi:ATP-dependent DNA helicase DinG
MLDAALPSRLLSAFPPGVTVERLGLKDALARLDGFYADAPATLPDGGDGIAEL